MNFRFYFVHVSLKGLFNSDSFTSDLIDCDRVSLEDGVEESVNLIGKLEHLTRVLRALT